MTQRTFYPGDRWIYFKIYSPPTLTDYILTERIDPLVNRWIKEEVIGKWFYIRYWDTGHHIRLRTELTDLNHIGKVVTELRKQLSEELENGTVSGIQLDTYQRELERYGADSIEKCESFFFEDSSKVLVTIKDKTEDMELICNSIIWLLNLLVSLGMSDIQVKEYMMKMEDKYLREFSLSTSQIKVINNEYRKHSSEIMRCIQELYRQPRQKDDKTAWIIAPEASQYLLSSLVHMHVNRVFAMNQRLYEYIVYHMANKAFESVIKKTAHDSEI